MNLFKKLNFTLMEKINLILSLFIFIFSYVTLNEKLKYGGTSFLIASIISIIFVNFSPFKFKNFERNVLQIHINISIVFGTILNFYSYITEFDFYLHILFGIVASVLSIPFIKYFLEKSNLKISNISIPFIIFMIFCFSSTCGVIWEIYEFTVDNLFNLNTQNSSLLDTMTDIIANTIGILIFCTFYYFKKMKNNETK